jgi:hypothetical protein
MAAHRRRSAIPMIKDLIIPSPMDDKRLSAFLRITFPILSGLYSVVSGIYSRYPL